MSPRPDTSLRTPLAAEHAAVRRAHMLRAVLAAAGRAALALAAVVVLGLALPLTPATATGRAGLFAAAALVTLALAVRAFLRAAPRFDPWLEQVEERFPETRSWLRNALDLEKRPDPRTSAELADAVRMEARSRLDRVALASMRPAVAWRGAALHGAAAVAVLVLAMASAPDATRRAWRTLWDPSLAAPPVALVVEPGSVTVSPGATLAIRARVTGTQAAPRLLGEGPSPSAVLEAERGSERRWRFDLPPVTAPRDYAVRVQRTESPRYAIALAGEPQPVSFRTEITPPAYARLPLQRGAGTTGDLAALAGSRVEVEVTYDRDLESLEARLPDGRIAAWTALTPRRWRGLLTVKGDAEWGLHAVAAHGSALHRYRVRAGSDGPPVLAVVVPTGDVDVPAGQQVAYDVEAQDDLGLSALELDWRKTPEEPWRTLPLARLTENPRQARLAARWDASQVALLPGEAATFRFAAWDNDAVHGRKRAVSGEFQLRFPSLAELYDDLDDRAEQVQRALERTAENARELQKSLEQMQRQPQRGAGQPDPFQRAEEMQRALARQSEMAKALDQAAEAMSERAADAAEREAFREQLQQKLQQMSELLREIQDEEFRESVKRLEQALERADRREAERALPEVREQNRDMLEQIQRSLELLQQLRAEERMEALGQRAEELKQRQDALNDEHGQSPSESERARAAQDLAKRQQKAAQDSRELAQSAREQAREPESESVREALEQAAEQLEQEAAEQQEQAALEQQNNQPQRAQRSGRQASQALDKAAQSMQQSAQMSQNQRDAMNLEALRRSAQDLVSLERSTQQNLRPDADPARQSDRQQDLSEGVARVADSLASLSERTPFMSPRIQQSLGRAQRQLQQSGQQMSGGQRQAGEQSGRQAAQSLAEAVNALREAEAACSQPGQGNPGQQGQRGQKGRSGQQPDRGEQVGQMGQQQGRINQQSREIARRMSQQMRMQAGDEGEMRRLADEQRRIREQLREVIEEEARDQRLLGRLDQTEREMREVEEQLRAGQAGDDLEERQTRILSRLLDAQRSLNRRDFDPQREARRGTTAQREVPAELRPDLLRTEDRLRGDLLRAGADRYPTHYRALIEAYLRVLNASPR